MLRVVTVAIVVDDDIVVVVVIRLVGSSSGEEHLVHQNISPRCPKRGTVHLLNSKTTPILSAEMSSA